MWSHICQRTSTSHKSGNKIKEKKLVGHADRRVGNLVLLCMASNKHHDNAILQRHVIKGSKI